MVLDRWTSQGQGIHSTFLLHPTNKNEDQLKSFTETFQVSIPDVKPTNGLASGSIQGKNGCFHFLLGENLTIFPPPITLDGFLHLESSFFTFFFLYMGPGGKRLSDCSS